MSERELPPESEQAQVRAEIEQTRADLSGTVDALSDRLNVKARASDKVNEAVTEAKAQVNEAARRAKEAAPPPVQRALHVAGAKTQPVVAQVSQKAAPHRGKLLAGAAVAVVLLVVIRRRRRAPEAAP